jgi:hypothetical protein
MSSGKNQDLAEIGSRFEHVTDRLATRCAAGRCSVAQVLMRPRICRDGDKAFDGLQIADQLVDLGTPSATCSPIARHELVIRTLVGGGGNELDVAQGNGSE